MPKLEKSQEIKKMFIKYVFTREEKEALAAELASKYSARQSLIEKKKEITSALAAELNAIESGLTELARSHNQGWKMTNYDCYEIFDYEGKLVLVYRADTDEKVDSRIMSSSEFHKELFDSKEKIDKLPEKAKFACFLDLGTGDMPEGPHLDCVIDKEKYDDCKCAKKGMKKEECEHWKINDFEYSEKE